MYAGNRMQELNDWKLTLVLDRMRSAYNVGNILRIAEAVKADGVIGCGYTPLPPHIKLEKPQWVRIRWCRAAMRKIPWKR